MLNAVGLQNPGVDKVISEELPKLKACFHKPVMANISGFSTDEYAYVCERLNAEKQIGWFEVNISCPNVHNGGMSFGTSAASAAEVTLVTSTPFDSPCVVSPAANTGARLPVNVAARRKAESALKTCDFFMKFDSSSSIAHLQCVRIACHMRRKLLLK